MHERPAHAGKKGVSSLKFYCFHRTCVHLIVFEEQHFIPHFERIDRSSRDFMTENWLSKVVFRVFCNMLKRDEKRLRA